MHREEILFIEACFRKPFIKMENDLLHLLTLDNKVSICIQDYIIYSEKNWALIVVRNIVHKGFMKKRARRKLEF